MPRIYDMNQRLCSYPASLVAPAPGHGGSAALTAVVPASTASSAAATTSAATVIVVWTWAAGAASKTYVYDVQIYCGLGSEPIICCAHGLLHSLDGRSMGSGGAHCKEI